MASYPAEMNTTDSRLGTTGGRRARILPGLVLMLLSALSFAAVAQGVPGPGDLSQLTNATPAGDWSMKLWRFIFGNFADNPFTPGGPTTLLGNIFVVFNTAIFTVGIAWVLYGVVGGVVQTAHEGEVLGKRMSTVWYPIRTVIGVAGMVPIFGGFTLFQALMMMFTVVGIGIGNTMWTAAINGTSAMQAIVNDSKFVPTAKNDIRDAVQSVFVSGVCMAAQLDAEAGDVTYSSVVAMNRAPVPFGDAQQGGYTFGSPDSPVKCGKITAKAPTARSDGDSMLAFRVDSVNYAKIAENARKAYLAGMNTSVERATTAGMRWYTERKQAMAAGQPVPPIPFDMLNAIASDFVGNAKAAIAQGYGEEGGAIKAQAKRNMEALGWFGAGAWFSTFAEANAAIADAAKGPTLHSQPPGAMGWSGLHSETQRVVQSVVGALAEQDKTRNAGESGDGSRAILDSALTDHCAIGGVNLSGALGTATGNCSLGQSIVSVAIRGTAIGSGGGGNGAGSLSFDAAGLVNPIIMLKNMGDYVMSFSSAVLTANVAGFLLPDSMKGVGGAITNVASKIPGVGEKLTQVWSVLSVAAIITLVLGAMLAIYIPLIPFIVWMGAILAYAASVIEGLAGASLHAMAHLDSDGDGLGQRTAQGYLHMINVVARPALMIVGFFVATALLIVVGTLQAHLFLPAMAGVQGNSLTGFFSIGAFLIVFFTINVTLIHSAFNLIFIITDQVIGFVGGAINSHLGRDTEDKVSNMFLLAARFGPNAIGAGKDALKAGAKAGAGAAGQTSRGTGSGGA